MFIFGIQCVFIDFVEFGSVFGELERLQIEFALASVPNPQLNCCRYRMVNLKSVDSYVCLNCAID